MSNYSYIVTPNYETCNKKKKDPYTFYGPFEKNNLIILPVTKNNAKNTTINFKTSKLKYKHEGKECNLLFLFKKNFCFGINKVFPYQEEKRTDEQLQGYQISYNMLEKEEEENPPKDAKYIMDSLMELKKRVIEYIGQQSLIKNNLPPNTISFYQTNKHECVKDIFSKPTESKTERPPRMYIKLMTVGNGTSIRTITNLYDCNTSQRIDIDDYLDQPCAITPIVLAQDIYWGAHGNLNCGASIRFKLQSGVISRRESNVLSEDSITCLLDDSDSGED